MLDAPEVNRRYPASDIYHLLTSFLCLQLAQFIGDAAIGNVNAVNLREGLNRAVEVAHLLMRQPQFVAESLLLVFRVAGNL